MVRNHKRKVVTAKELTERLASDPDYQERMAAKRTQQLQQAAVQHSIALPVMRALQEAGCKIGDLNQLRESVLRYGGRAVCVLMEWLPRINDPRVKEVIARALAVEAARPAAPLLVREFHRADDKTQHALKWALGNALEVVADDTILDDVIAIATDTTLGPSRSMVVMALGNMKDRRGLETALALLHDPEAAGPAIKAIRKLNAELMAKPQLEDLARFDKRAWVRQEAKKALKAAESKKGVPPRTQ